MLKRAFAVVVAAAGLAMPAAVRASVLTPYVGVEFENGGSGHGGLNTYSPGAALAGYVPQEAQYFNSYPDKTSGATGLLDDNGNGTGINLAIVNDNNDYFTNSGSTANDWLLSGESKNNTNGGTATYTLGNVPTLSAGESYSVIVYIETDENNNPQNTYAVGVPGNSTLYGSDAVEEQSAFNGTFIAATSGSPGNYVEFDNVAPDGNGNLTISETDDGNAVAINGFQLVVASPEPASAGLLMLGAAGMLLRRRRKARA